MKLSPLHCIIAGMVGGVVSHFIFNTAARKILRARELQVVDEKKRTRVKMGMDDGRPFVGLFDEREKARSGMYLDKNGEPGISFVDSRGQIRLLLNMEENDPQVTLFNEGGSDAISMGSTDEYSTIWICDQGGRERINMAVLDSEPFLKFCNRDEKAVIWMGLQDEDAEFVERTCDDGSVKTVLKVEEEPYFNVLDDEEIVWSVF